MSKFIMNVLSLYTVFFVCVNSKPHQRFIQIKNESGQRLELYLVTNNVMVLQTPNMVNGQSVELSSSVNHTFLVREQSGDDGTCNEGTKYSSPSLSPVCKSAFITVNDHDSQVFRILRDMEIHVEDNDSKLNAFNSLIVSKCKQTAQSQLHADIIGINAVIDNFASCAQELVAQQLEKHKEEIAYQDNLRTSIGLKWEEYTCADFDLPTTSPQSTYVWKYKEKEHEVGVLLARDEAKIQYVDNFITPEECAAIEAAAAPTLHHATVADGSGGSHLQKSRKAMQAGVRVPWEREADGELISRISRKLYAFINDATGYDIQSAGQEDLMSIQYFGRGLNDTEPDRYKPHCDGQCDGLKFKEAGRVATMVMYCKAPLKGGATNFRNVGIHVVPKVGAAVFFSYLGSDGRTDDSLTEHSCCPVFEGEKKIAVQWLRLGVDEMNPWNSFNTLNVKISSAEDM